MKQNRARWASCWWAQAGLSRYDHTHSSWPLKGKGPTAHAVLLGPWAVITMEGKAKYRVQPGTCLS